MFTTVLLETTQISSSRQMVERVMVQTMEYSLAIKRNKLLILIHATTRMSYKSIIMLVEKSVSKVTHCMIPFL